MRKKIAAGNWKMYKSFSEAQQLAGEISAGIGSGMESGKEVILCVPFPYLIPLSEIVKSTKGLSIAAQNAADHTEGAYTGEVSSTQLASSGISYVVLGHSERRTYYGESHAILKTKTDLALAAGLHPIFCCGEPKEIREAGTHEALVAQQIEESLFHLSAEEFSKIVIAYEPVWAIGTGLTATSAQAQEMHAFVRSQIAAKYGSAVAEGMTILYGGSVKAANAGELFGMPDVDGGLVGGASLQSAEFLQIIACLS